MQVVRVCDLSERQGALLAAARAESEKATLYMKVGAAILAGDEIITGAYSLVPCGTRSICTKRAVLYELDKLNRNQFDAVTAMATYVQTGDRNIPPNPDKPCSACRQDYMKVRRVSDAEYISGSSSDPQVAVAKFRELFPGA